MQLFLLICLFILLGGISAYFAKERGRDPLTWFVIGVCFGFMGLLLLFLLPSYGKSAVAAAAAATAAKTEGPSLSSQNDVHRHEYWEKEWFYLDADHKQQGPYAFDRFQDLWEIGKLNSRSFVWCESLKEWQKIEKLPALLDLLPPLAQNFSQN